MWSVLTVTLTDYFLCRKENAELKKNLLQKRPLRLPDSSQTLSFTTGVTASSALYLLPFVELLQKRNQRYDLRFVRGDTWQKIIRRGSSWLTHLRAVLSFILSALVCYWISNSCQSLLRLIHNNMSLNELHNLNHIHINNTFFT